MRTSDEPGKRTLYILSGAGGLLLIAWGVMALMPTLRAWMLDFVAAFLVALLVTGVLWWAARQSTDDARVFWRLLAWAWTLGIAGNIAWGVHDYVTGESLAIFSLIDGFYIARYILVFWAFWRYPRRTRQAGWAAYGVLLAAATALIWAALFRPVMADISQPVLFFLGGALYPIMDIALLYAAWAALTYTANPRMRVALRGLALALIAYTLANWINFRVRSEVFEASSLMAGLFWLLSDAGTGAAALYAIWPPTIATLEPRTAPATTLPERLPAIATLFTVGLVVADGIVRHTVDTMLLTCAIITLVLTGYYRLSHKKHFNALTR
ncbi:MAG TPA: hypothetical protein PLJ78_00870 [Anaerolineae bacterium]|nr:hypothetical protein [Anaerolineae bacterium]HQK12475.1 hypothetical protein [Anaerolineae bacterium]